MTQALGRSARKRQTILSAGRDLFLSNGYQGTSVDQIAASAEVSKQTVYKHFGDKHELLLAIVNHALDSTVTPFLKRIRALADTAHLEADLTALAADYLRAVLQEPVVQLRRLVVGEANRVPELAQLYYDQAPARTLAAFAECFSVLHDRGLLRVPEPAHCKLLPTRRGHAIRHQRVPMQRIQRLVRIALAREIRCFGLC